MSAVNRIVFECVDSALSSFESIDKTTFYQYLQGHYQVNFQEFADKFEVVHEALTTVYGLNHYKIERMIIRILNDRANQGVYARNDEVQAFGCMVNIFIAETERTITKQKIRNEQLQYTKSLENRVKEANEKLQDAERMVAIGETAAMVGHDIRNPLQAIVGELYIERDDISSLPEGQIKDNLWESVRSIEENIFYINKIVSDLQDFARPLKSQAGDDVDINQVIAEALSIVPIPNSLHVEIYVNDGFPLIKADFQMLKRALTNLIQNAVQAMQDGGKLTIRAACDLDTAQISVEDTGPGIPEEVKHKLFMPLFTTKSKGQGLGLAVVKRLVEAQNGRIRFESENGKGAKFIMEFPQKKRR